MLSFLIEYLTKLKFIRNNKNFLSLKQNFVFAVKFLNFL